MDVIRQFLAHLHVYIMKKSKSPLNENSSLKPKSYYGVTKLKIEKILKGYKKKYPKFSCVILRYFNPVGADKTNSLRDNPKKAENIIPNISNVIKGKKRIFNIFGNDYPTKDGTCMRDYIHIIDLASSHVKILVIYYFEIKMLVLENLIP